MFRKDQEEGRGFWTDGRPKQISVDYVIEISAMVLVQSVFPGSSKCLLDRSVLPVPSPSSSGCRQGSKGPSRQAPLPGSYRGFTFSPNFLAHLVIFLITSGFKGVPFYFLPVPIQLAPAQGKRPVITKGVVAHTTRLCSEWDLQDKMSCGTS